ncbi:hypothetical protein B0181_00750 [Moraxella caviae]|uniref:Uncharacterized protein n=1 Tax=Moraxella caviae TaxID=34060 RepID=A0A1T0ABW1_9GAMM|nr:hypothetical protein B0181_00750 [Moraxella caviae]
MLNIIKFLTFDKVRRRIFKVWAQKIVWWIVKRGWRIKIGVMMNAKMVRFWVCQRVCWAILGKFG